MNSLESRFTKNIWLYYFTVFKQLKNGLVVLILEMLP